MPKFSILIARFPYHGDEKATVTDWLVETVVTMKSDPTIGQILHRKVDDTPITMTRNKVCREAQLLGVDYILMVDADMAPDLSLPGAKKFWPSTWEFVKAHQGPCVVGAPYCGPPPHENVYIFQWATRESDAATKDFRCAQYSREEAAKCAGFHEVAALPTGLMLFPTSVLDRIGKPWFKYEWTDEYEMAKATTEDVFFTRNLSLAGVPNYVNWDAWAGHWKQKCVGKPWLLTKEQVGKELEGALTREAGEVLREITPDGIPTPRS